MKHCLDSWVVLAWLDGEDPAGELVERAFDLGRPVMSWINLIEVEYRIRRRRGIDEAETVLAAVRERVEEVLPQVAAMRSVAVLKAEHPIALADCFAITTAAATDARLITGDPEIIERSGQLPCQVVDARG